MLSEFSSSRAQYVSRHTMAQVAGTRDFRDICSSSSPDLWTIFATYFFSLRIRVRDSKGIKGFLEQKLQENTA